MRLLTGLFKSNFRLVDSTTSLRFNSISTKSNVPIALISKIRSIRPGTPLSLARSALQASQNDLDGALSWISEQAASSGAAKAKKLEGRIATEGLIGVALVSDGMGGTGVRGAMVEISCETDFVARTEEFKNLVEQVTRTLAFFAEPASMGSEPNFMNHTTTSIEHSPLIPLPSSSSVITPASSSPLPTIATAISTLVSRLGENISLRRSMSVSIPPVSSGTTTHLASTYLHNSSSLTLDFQSGSLASLLLFRLPPGGELDKVEVKGLLRALARQVVAVPTEEVRPSTVEAKEVNKEGEGEEEEQSKYLYEQSLITLSSSAAFQFEPGSTVGKVLNEWSRLKKIEQEGLQVVEIKRWSVGGKTI